MKFKKNEIYLLLNLFLTIEGLFQLIFVNGQLLFHFRQFFFKFSNVSGCKEKKVIALLVIKLTDY